MGLLFLLSIGVLFYVYAGYPALLRLILAARGPRRVTKRDILPPVTLIISAYNEAEVVRRKLENSLELEYPSDLLEIIVISDASTDGTDDIVRSFAPSRVQLQRQAERRGKTAGLNATVPHVSGEIVVFSDANALYQPDAVRMLVRSFADPSVGCVTGEARYVRGGTSAADRGERAYWDYEIQIKRLETAVGSMVGGDGAIYAIRRELWQTLPENAINDFLNPLQIVAAGWRAVYEPEAVCYEETAGGTRREYDRRVRIVSRSWRAVFQAPGVLNPFRVGLFSLSIVSHKILRWLSGIFVLTAVVSLLGLQMRTEAAHVWLVLGVAVAALMLLTTVSAFRRHTSVSLYFLVLGVASVVGVFKGVAGRVSGTWSTVRMPGSSNTTAGLGFDTGRFVGGALALGALVIVGLAYWAGTQTALEALFWGSLAVLVYIYAGYPICIGMIRRIWRRPLHQEAIEPRVCLLITANDEESVIDAKLRNSLMLDYPSDRLQILVVSDGSVDRTNDITRSFHQQGVVLMAFPERRGKIAAINEAMGAVTAEIVVFSDANTLLKRDAIAALVRNFADPAVGGVSGDVALVGERAALGYSEDLYYRYERWLQQAESDIGSMVGVDGALYAIRRELFVAPFADTILDDMAIPMAVVRAGHRVVFEPEALAVERGSETASEEFERKSRVVAGAVQFLGRDISRVPLRNVQVVVALVSHKALRWLSPTFAIALIGASIALRPVSVAYEIIAFAQAAFLMAALAGCFKPVRRWNVIGFAHYFWLVQIAAAVGFVRGVLGMQAVAWRRYHRAPLET